MLKKRPEDHGDLVEDDDDDCHFYSTILTPHQTAAIVKMIKQVSWRKYSQWHFSPQLDNNLVQEEGREEEEIREAFIEFYKLLGDYKIINMEEYVNINCWRQERNRKF